MSTRPFVAVVGHQPMLEREDGAAQLLRALGAEVRTLPLWARPRSLLPTGEDGPLPPAVLIVELLERPDWAAGALRELRGEPALASCGVIVAVCAPQVTGLDPAAGFDDFVLIPYVPAELYARVRTVEWRHSEFTQEERIKVGTLVIDRAAHEVTLAGALVPLTAREFGLLDHMCGRRGRVVRRNEALAAVWGPSYDGGPRTVDIHVRRLRQKLGEALPLETVRGVGYKVTAVRSNVTSVSPPESSSAAEAATDFAAPAGGEGL